MVKVNEIALFVRKGNSGIIRIPYTEIFFIETTNRKLYVYTESNRYEIDGTITEILETLNKNCDYFFLCHRACIVNIHQVKTVENELISLFNNTDVPLSRLKKNALKQRLKEVHKS